MTCRLSMSWNLFDIFNIMAIDDLAIQGARASTGLILTCCILNIQDLVCKGLNKHELHFHLSKLLQHIFKNPKTCFLKIRECWYLIIAVYCLKLVCAHVCYFVWNFSRDKYEANWVSGFSCMTRRRSMIYLTHWGRDKMDAISHTTFSNAFSWMKMFEFLSKFHWSLFPRVQLRIFHHWFR